MSGRVAGKSQALDEQAVQRELAFLVDPHKTTNVGQRVEVQLHEVDLSSGVVGTVERPYQPLVHVLERLELTARPPAPLLHVRRNDKPR